MSSVSEYTQASAPQYKIESTGRDEITFTASGTWTLLNIRDVNARLIDDLVSEDYAKVRYVFKDLEALDTAGAYILARAIKCEDNVCYPFEIIDGARGHEILMKEAAEASMGRPQEPTRQWFDTLARLGRGTEHFLKEGYDTLAFLGHFFVVLFRSVLMPGKIRWKSVIALTEEVGLHAAPIIMTLSFFIGAVIAYMGANLLASFGAQVYMVELIGVSVLREFAVIITAIMLAGRSDSAFTAQIGAMKMRQEIDAMTVIGLDTYEALVIPRALATLISAPILTFLAMLSGIGGGLLVAWGGATDISPILFFARFRETIDLNHFWVGMIKSPVFAIVIAVIGCRQGLAVSGSVDSLGSRVTSSVVQAIFSVIALDAIFAILFYQMGV